jgi:hypothetical protein
MDGISFENFPSVFARLKGRNGFVREYPAILSFSSDYCVIPKPDSFVLGYPETAHVGYIVRPPNLATMVAPNGFATGVQIKMQEVQIGTIKVMDVDFVAFDLPQAGGVDLVLGKSLLRHLKVEIDYTSKKLNIASAPAQENTVESEES